MKVLEPGRKNMEKLKRNLSLLADYVNMSIHLDLWKAISGEPAAENLS
jgi:hypothetical protein